jgi:hypothetical protein
MARRTPFTRLGRRRDAPLLAPDVDDETREEDASRRLVIQVLFRGIVIFMVVMSLGYWAISTILGSGIFVPKSAEEVLHTTSRPSYYAWSSESVRQATLAGVPLREDTFRSAVVDLGLNKFQALAVGVFNTPTIYLSDSHLTADYTQSGQQSGQGWQLITDYCAHAPTIPATDLQMPTAAEIEAAHPKLISSNASIFGTQAWVMSFKPSPAIVEQAFWVPFFEAVTSQARQNREWVLSEQELAAIRAGHITLDYAYAWVSRSPRELRQVEMRFYTNPQRTSGYRFLIKLYPPEGRPLTSTTFGSTDCTNNTTSTVGGSNSALPKVPTNAKG